jgi:hypothetical protein
MYFVWILLLFKNKLSQIRKTSNRWLITISAKIFLCNFYDEKIYDMECYLIVGYVAIIRSILPFFVFIVVCDVIK